MLVGGVNEAADEAVFYVLDGAGQTLFFASDLRPSLRASTVRGVCAGPGHFVVVGDEPITQGIAFAFHSTDGVVWEDLTDALPGDPGSLSRCVIKGDALFAAGAGGSVFRYDF